MGLVTCSKCKKVYDYDKYNGICPKCARYNKETTAAQDHQEYHNRYDGGYSHNARDDHHSYHERYDNNRNPHGSQLDGVQETLREVMGAEHKVNLEAGKTKYSMDKKTKILLGIVGVILFFSLFTSLGVLLIPLIVGVAVYKARTKK